MSLKLSHRRKVHAKKFGRVLIRRFAHVIKPGDTSLFDSFNTVGAGKNKLVGLHTMIATQSGSGRSFLTDKGGILEELTKQDNQDGGNRVEEFIREIESRSMPTDQ